MKRYVSVCRTQTIMYKLFILSALVAVAAAGVVGPYVSAPVVHTVHAAPLAVSHATVVRTHNSIVHPSPVVVKAVHAAPVVHAVHAAPVVHAVHAAPVVHAVHHAPALVKPIVAYRQHVPVIRTHHVPIVHHAGPIVHSAPLVHTGVSYAAHAPVVRVY